MRRTSIGGTEVESTVLGLGTADIFASPTRRSRARLIDAALDAGIRHFDVAPMYGLGAAEAELGRLLARRGDTVVATKFGIEPTLVAHTLRPIQAPLQRMRRPSTAKDPRAGRGGSALYAAPGYTGPVARRTLERSLRRLRRDRIDLFFLHDPGPGTPVSDDVRAALEDAQRRGEVGAWGAAGEPAAVAAAKETLGGVPVSQVRSDVLSGSAQADIAFGILGRALPALRAHLQQDARAAAWSETLDVDVLAADAIQALLLQEALARADVVLVGSRDPAHVAALALAADAATPARVDRFRQLVAEALG
ncbi:MAG TPA: aldo/keto reductase [Gaiellaceae bacterium]|nr:aldo/keto reductase [Gaiellaceae bacterium]